MGELSQSEYSKTVRQSVVYGMVAVGTQAFSAFYLLFHLGLGIAICNLEKPFVIVALITFPLGVLCTDHFRSRAVSKPGIKWLYLVITAYALAICLVYAVYGVQYRIVTREQAIYFYGVLLITTAIIAATGWITRNRVG